MCAPHLKNSDNRPEQNFSNHHLEVMKKNLSVYLWCLTCELCPLDASCAGMKVLLSQHGYV